MRFIWVAPRARRSCSRPPQPSLLSSATGLQSEHLFVAVQVRSKSRQDHGRIDLMPMTHVEMDPIQIENAPVFYKMIMSPKTGLPHKSCSAAINRTTKTAE